MDSFTLHASIGYLTVHTQQNCLVGILFSANCSPTTPKTAFEKKVAVMLTQYFAEPTTLLQLPTQLNVTPFEKKVLAAISQIPVGETITYGAIAEKLNTGARAVANACRKNPLPLIIPCHRVVGKNNLGGFSGQTVGPLMAIKRWLLQHEASRTPC